MSEGISSARDAQWWLEPDDMKHERVLAVVRSIRLNQEHRKLQDLLHASMYGNLPMTGFGLASARSSIMSERLSLNVVRNMVGAVTSKIAAKNKPKPTFLTEEGNYEQRIQAENLEKFVGGVFYESGVYNELSECFRDCCVYGTGVLKAFEDGGKASVERVIPWELVVDDGEAMYGKPRSIYQRKYVDRLVLKHLWAKDDAEREQKIQDCPRDAEDTEFAYQTTADQVLVTEAWHLGEDDKTPGRHCIVIEGLTLLDEPWDGPFPFAFIRWTRPVVGFFGVGLAEELRGIQREINKLLQQIAKGHHLITGHWSVLQGSTLTTQINNDLGTIVKHTGAEPRYYVPGVIAPEVYNHLWQLYAKAFEIAGISQLSATSQKPASLDSGVALRTYNDIQTERFLEVGQAYEEFVVEAARQVIRCAKRIGGSYKVRAVDKSSISFIKWSEIELDEESYVIRVYPTSLLPTTPAGKLQWAQDMIQAGVIPPEDVLDIVDFPDTEAYAKRKNAPRRVIEKNIAKMLKTGEPVSPEPMDNHPLALKLSNEAYAEARLDGVPEAKLQRLRDYMAVTQSHMPKPAPPMPPPMDPAMGPPPMPMDPMAPPPPPPMDPAMPVAA
jgi:hypothetical protein